MKKIYHISQGQLLIIWFFSVIFWLKVAHQSCEWFKDICPVFGRSSTPTADIAVIIIPFLLLFYTVGWFNEQEKNKENVEKNSSN